MNQTDNFEFTPLKNIERKASLLESASKKQALKESKAVIRDLYTALNNQIQDHKASKKYILDLTSKISESNELIKTLEDSLASKNQQIQKIVKDLQDCQIKNKQYENQHIKFSNQLKQLKNHHSKTEYQRIINKQNQDNLKKILDEKIQKLKVAEQTISLILQQNRNLKAALAQRSQEQTWGIQQLRKINETFKNQFNALSEQIQAKQAIIQSSRHQQISPKINPFTITPEKTMRSYSNGHHQKFKNRTKSTAYFQKSKNPQSPVYKLSNSHKFDKKIRSSKLEQQIKQIKQQVSNQYALVNIKQQKYHKKRVDETLGQLKGKINRFMALKKGEITSEYE